MMRRCGGDVMRGRAGRCLVAASWAWWVALAGADRRTGARLWFRRDDRAGDPSRLRAASSRRHPSTAGYGQAADGLRGFRASLKQASW
ncbi:hypothetical protein BZL30_8491 [Mycobacterium kansasii]|uniref:Uncharacterized protein n=1 Tax=Mycobacterium kansasii TaxID=1768 RepID=A0A1V3WH97_MYCKA|nr:hypothetical protein BZL30_8491 [Mycobacterium kansasii]